MDDLIFCRGCNHILEPLPFSDELYCPVCEPSKTLGDTLDEGLSVIDEEDFNLDVDWDF